ncbi:MAG: adenylate kinase [Sulfurimonas sp.]|jgi:adenylate kinase|uniref:adenylate kinase n=1 Tax=Sulfurimonas sp. TaxID=2022749 RepID=UPI0039E6E531
MQKKLILLIGIPGCGKTTCAKLISQKHEKDITEYSTGTLIRQEIERGTAVGKISKDFFDKGDLVPTQIVLDIIVSAILNAPTEIVLIAGFPGKQKQLAYFGDYLFTHDQIDLISVIELQVSDALGKERFLSTGRSEDIFNHEMNAYKDSIEKIHQYYDEKNLLETINTEEDLDLVLNKIDEHLWSKIKEHKK